MPAPFEKVIVKTPGIELTVDQEGLKVLAYKIKKEANSGRLKRDLVAGLRVALAPAVSEAKSSIMSMPSEGRAQVGGGLRNAIAGRISARTRLTGAAIGASVVARKSNMPRDFNLAPKRTNAKSWRRKNFEGQWTTQIGKPEWFDEPMRAGKPRYRAAVIAAIEKMKMRLRGL